MRYVNNYYLTELKKNKKNKQNTTTLNTLRTSTVEYLNFPEDESIPDAVSPHDAFQHLRFLPPEGELQQPALQGAVGLAKDLQREAQTHSGITVGFFKCSLKKQ